jgi:hypothetical protein
MGADCAASHRQPFKPAPDGQLYAGLVDAIVALASALASKSVITREELAQTYEIAAEQQQAQGAGEARLLDCRTIQAFFAMPLAGDRSKIRLIVDNEGTSRLERLRASEVGFGSNASLWPRRRQVCSPSNSGLARSAVDLAVQA